MYSLLFISYDYDAPAKIFFSINSMIDYSLKNTNKNSITMPEFLQLIHKYIDV
jgi:hypothetical protein